jgi:hypothetical protein
MVSGIPHKCAGLACLYDISGTVEVKSVTEMILWLLLYCDLWHKITLKMGRYLQTTAEKEMIHCLPCAAQSGALEQAQVAQYL